MDPAKERELLIDLLSRIQGENRPGRTADLLLQQYGCLQSIVECIPMEEDGLMLSQNARMLLSMIPALSRRREKDRMGEHPSLCTLDAAARFAASLYIGAHYEQIYLLCLDENLCLQRPVLLNEGSMREVSFYPRRIMQEALMCNAQAVILCHNHLSGWCFFSEADQIATREFLRLCTHIQMPLLDHLLVAGNQVGSMRSKAYIAETDWRASGSLSPALSLWRAAPSGGSIRLLPYGDAP